MPLYEYTCSRCGKRFTVLVGMTATPDSGDCPHCGNGSATRRVTRFARGRTDDEIASGLVDPPGGDPGDDPRSMREWAGHLERELGEDLGDDFDDYLDAAEAGDDDDGDLEGGV
jgi:putative FmdB family regulatory protein